MGTDIRKIIRNLIAEALDEARKSIHVDDRYDERIATQKVDVGVKLSFDTFRKVGTFEIPNSSKEYIKAKIKEIEEIDFPMNLHVGVKITDFHLTPKNVSFSSAEDMRMAADQRLYLVGKGSNGDEVWVTVNSNTITSLMFRVKGAPYNTEWDYAASSINDLKKYLSGK